MEVPQNERPISKPLFINGTGSVAFLLDDNLEYRDVEVVGTFTAYGYSFIIHRDLFMMGQLAVSEASTGYRIMNECYPDVTTAMKYSKLHLNTHRVELPTRVGNLLVQHRINLLKRNLGVTTPAIISLL